MDIAGNSTHTGSSNPGRLTLSARADKLVANAPSSIQFLSTLTGGTGPYTYRWDFADGSFSTDQNPPHSYVAPGPRTVQLTVYDAK